MMAPELGREAQQAITLIKAFSLELDQYSPESQVLYWLHHYRAPWIRDAIIEAVYQGRYKIISVDHILLLWQRRGQPVCHFTSGFEQVIAAQLGTPLHLSPSMLSQPAQPVVQPAIRDSSHSSVSTAAPQTLNAAESAMSRYDDYSGVSIEAFPVDAEDTLVEVYQASTPAITYPSRPINNAMPARNEEQAYHIVSSPSKSFPIQPFRPTPRRKHASRG